MRTGLKALIILLLSSFTAKARHGKDSLLHALSNASHDTLKCILLSELIDEEADPNIWMKDNDKLKEICIKNLNKPNIAAKEIIFYKTYLSSAYHNVGFFYSEMDEFGKAMEQYKKSLETLRGTNNEVSLANTLNSIGLTYFKQSDLLRALEYYSKSLAIQQRSNNKEGIAHSLNNIAGVHEKMGNIPLAIDNYAKSLDFLEEIHDSVVLPKALVNIAYLYADHGDFKTAKEYYLRSLLIRKIRNDQKGIAHTLHMIGKLSDDQEMHDTALKYYRESLEIRTRIGDRRGIANSHNNIGYVFKKKLSLAAPLSAEAKRLYAVAEEHFGRALKIWEENKDKDGIALALNNLAVIQQHINNLPAALENAKKAYALSTELGFPDRIQFSAKNLYRIYKAKNDPQRALHFYELYIQSSDSVYSERARKATIKSQLKYEYEKQAAADSVAHAKENEVKSAELSRQTTELKAKKNQQYALFGGLFAVCLFALFMFNRFRVTQKQKIVIEMQKQEVEEQKKLVEEKQKEILDSIHYAKKIQLAHIPAEKRLASMLNRLRTP